MGTSALPDAIDWLYDTCLAAPTLGAADPPVLVLDGVDGTDLSALRVLFVGVADAQADEAVESGTGTQEWAGLGAMAKNDLITITSTIRAWSGDTSIRAARRAAFDVLGAVENLVRADAKLGGTVLFTLPGITNVRYRAGVGKQGAIAEVVFDLAAKARI